jgi:hypothetical protein
VPRCVCAVCWDSPAPAAPALPLQRLRTRFLANQRHAVRSPKLPIRDYLAAVAIFCNEVKGKSALALSRDLGVQYKTAFVLAHKIREAMAAELKGLRIGGAGRIAEVDGAYFGGHVRPENRKADRKDLRLAENRSGSANA